MKKRIAMFMAVCLILVSGVGTVTSSAVEIQPFASPVISSVDFYISSSLCYFNAKLNESFSGNVSANIQKDVNGTWKTDTVICSNDNFSSNTIYKSKSCSLGSGTYRIEIILTINGVTYTHYTGSKSV